MEPTLSNQVPDPAITVDPLQPPQQPTTTAPALTLSQFWDVVQANTERLKNTVQKSILNNTKKGPTAYELEDLLPEIFCSTAEKIEAGTLLLYNATEVLKYLNTACVHSYSRTKKNGSRQIDTYSFVQENYEDEELDPIPYSLISQKILNYVFSNYPKFEATLFQTYVIAKSTRKITYAEFAELTGYSESKCFRTITKIQKDPALKSFLEN